MLERTCGECLENSSVDPNILRFYARRFEIDKFWNQAAESWGLGTWRGVGLKMVDPLGGKLDPVD